MSAERSFLVFFRRILPRLFYTLCACAAGLIVAFGLVEIFFRTAGFFKKQRVYEGTVLSHTIDESVILCVGDSHTEGIGAPKHYNYPTQLSAILNSASNCRKKYRVVNLGFSGFNSSQATNRLLDYIRENSLRPDLVIFNAGRNNSHNFSEAHFLPEDVRGLSTSDQIQHLFSNSRAFRFGLITRSRLRQLLKNSSEMEKPLDEADFSILGDAEESLLQKWLYEDIGNLARGVKGAGGRFLLLNYVFSPAWLNEAYTQASKDFSVGFVDVQYFHYASTAAPWIKHHYMKASHPNEYGYALIAEMVYSEMVNEEIVPLKCARDF